MKWLIFATLLIPAAVLGIPSNAEPRTEPWWVDRHASFVQRTIDSNGSIPIIFFGASWCEGWGGNGRPIFDQFYTPLNVSNYGIGGDRVEHVLWRVLNGEVEGLRPKLIVLPGVGNNNFGSDANDDILYGILTLVSAIRQKLPDTKILLSGMFPRSDVAGWFQRGVDMNIKMSKMDNGNDIRFVNYLDYFAENFGTVRADIYEDDRLHFKEAGYAIWADKMNELFYEMLE